MGRYVRHDFEFDGTNDFFQRADTAMDIRTAVRLIPSTHNFFAADNQAHNGVGTGGQGTMVVQGQAPLSADTIAVIRQRIAHRAPPPGSSAKRDALFLPPVELQRLP